MNRSLSAYLAHWTPFFLILTTPYAQRVHKNRWDPTHGRDCFKNLIPQRSLFMDQQNTRHGQGPCEFRSSVFGPSL